MSLSHFDEKSGIVSCKTPWGQWWQTVSEVFIEVEVPRGTRGKDCHIVIKTGYIDCKVKDDVIFKGDLFKNVLVDDCTWTLEEQKKIVILLAKVQKYTNENMWESLLSDEYAPDAWTREEMIKKLDLEKFQVENGSGDEGSSPRAKADESDGSASDAEAQESQEQADDGSSNASSPPQSPSGSVDAEHSEDEVHISEAEVSNQGSDNEENRNERESEGSDDERSDEEAEKQDQKDVEDSVPEINIQSEDEEDGGGSAKSDNEDGGGSVKSDNEDGGGSVKSDNEDDVSNNNAVDEDQSEGEGDTVEDSGRVSPEDVDKAEKASPKSSPHPGNSDNEDNDQGHEEEEEAEEKVEAEEKADSDAEGSDHEKNEKGDYGDLIANIFGDSDEEEEFDGFGEDDIKAVRKKKEQVLKTARVLSDSEGEKSETEEVADQEQEEKDDDYEEQNEHKSDVEEDKDVGEEMDVEEPQSASMKKAPQPVSDDDSDDGIRNMREDFVSDFDLMMMKKKEESSRRRKKKDVDIINDSDDLIADIISQMRQAADEDRVLNKMKKTATKKLKILPLVMSQLKKQDLKMAFLDQGVLNVIADWLAPLPDRSLPNLQIREGMIKMLDEFPSFDMSLLKSSGVGRALMYLYKHPKETKENKEKAGRLITEWARPIFNVTTDYHSLTKEEREQRDFDHIPKKRKRDQAEDPDESMEKKDIDKALNEGDRKLRPGDKGWVGRARVPLPSTKDYVYRPKWNVEMECSRGRSSKPISRYEKHIRSQQEKKRLSKCQRAVTISIEGRNMAI